MNLTRLSYTEDIYLFAVLPSNSPDINKMVQKSFKMFILILDSKSKIQSMHLVGSHPMELNICGHAIHTTQPPTMHTRFSGERIRQINLTL